MGRPCPNCHAREPIDMHSCSAEKVLRKQRQEFRFNWDDVDGGQSPAKVARKPLPAAPKVNPKAEASPFLVSCGQCDLCLERRPEYCRAVHLSSEKRII